MEEQPQIRRMPAKFVAGISALVLTVGGVTAGWLWTSQRSQSPVTEPNALETSQPSATPNNPETAASPETVSPTANQTVEIYLLKDNGLKSELAPLPVKVPADSQPADILTVAFNTLLTNTDNDSGTFSNIPQGTQLRSLTIKDDGIYVDLSQDFKYGGGSNSMIGRLQQVLYTATSLDPNAQVWISLEGQPLTLLGGEGLEIPQPLSRQLFQSEFPQ